MKKTGRKNSVISTGTVSIVLIFVLLSMLTFAVLSLVSAQADLRLSAKSAQRTTDYYEAENSANDVLIEIDKLVKTEAGSCSDENELAKRISEKIDAGVQVEADGGRLSYEVPAGEEQSLEVEIAVSLEDNGSLEIEKWKTKTDHEWTEDSGGGLFDINDLPFAE